MLASLILATPVPAQTVQRWQDHAGQWHFGDHAAAKGHASQPVLIKTPISIIGNNQPAYPTVNTMAATAPKSRKTGKTVRATLVAGSKAATTTITDSRRSHCDALRQQLYDRSAKSKKSPSLATLNARYEHECIAGQFYGN